MWIRPAGTELAQDAGGYSGYVKVRDEPTIKSKKVKKQNQDFRKAALECKGKDQAEFRECMSSNL